jgi:hypothetical protein
VPSQTAQPAPVQPAAVQPTQPAARLPTAAVATPRPRPTAETPTRVAQPGDLICITCGEPNDPTRKFCRRCGTSLAMAMPAVKVPWWRRIFQRKPKTFEAGERKKAMQASARPRRGLGARAGFVLRWAVLGLVLVGAVGYMAVPSVGSAINGGLRGLVDTVRGIVSPSLDLVHAASTRASLELKDHPAKNLSDGATNTDWQAADDSAVLTFTFERPINIGAMNLWNGAADPKTKALRTDLRRPAQLVLTSQTGQSVTIDLQDIHDKQTPYFDLSGVETLTIKITQTNGPASAPVSFSEFEFLKKG